MRKRRLLVDIAFMAITLTSCSFNESGSENFSATSESLALSSASMESENSRASSSSHRVSLPRYSFGEESSSYTRPPFNLSSATTYYTVSIYQSYLIPDKGIYGNPRFDFSVRIEAGKPLYATADERHELIEACNQIYNPNGGIYSINGFYSDETCQRFIGYQSPINSDTRVYYYCNG